MKTLLVALIFCFSCLAAVVSAEAAIIPPASVSVTGSGTYYNSASLISNSVFPGEGSVWTGPQCTYWYGTAPYFVLDLGGNFNLNAITVSVDNNDSYRIDYSSDNSSWAGLHTIAIGEGNIGWGMDTFFDIPVDVSARYLKIYSIGGDNMYSIGELNAYGSAPSTVPEPLTVLLFGMGGLATALSRRKK